MAIGPGSRLGPYEVTALIGEGGMGKVWRAHHTGLKRDDALKVLPDAFASDPDRLARFQREAQVLASLNHPNIAHVHGLERADGVQALVMELVEGPTLADRIANGPMPIDEALTIAKQIAEALEAAHEQGIIHRDLKPANVKVRPDGTVKVLDFGLAKALEPKGTGSIALSQSPTITSPAMTGVGVVLGTAAYMSPEQARGKAVDKRSDIWAFGCVVYEMLTGKRAFEDEDVSMTLSKVLQREPDFEAFRADVPAHVRQTVRLCLRKSPRERVGDIHDVRLGLEGAFETAASQAALAVSAGAKPLWRRALPVTVASIFAALIAGLAAWNFKPSSIPVPAPQPVARLTVALPADEELIAQRFPGIAVSPDGAYLVYVAQRRGIQQLHVRSMSSLESRALVGTEGAVAPFFSPDGRWIGFFAEGKLKKIPVSGGSAQVVCASAGSWGGSWAPNDVIYFAPGSFSGLWQVSANGGTPRPFTKLDSGTGEVSHRWPQVLLGGEAVLFTSRTGPGFDEWQIQAQRVSSGERRMLAQGSTGSYVPTGHLLYVQAATNTLVAVPFDPTRLQVGSSPPVAVAQGIMSSGEGAQYTASGNGVLAYLGGPFDENDRTLVWVDRNGKSDPLKAPARYYESPRVSPDGTHVAFTILGPKIDLWVYNVARNTATRSPADGSIQFPMWTPDGKRLTYRQTLGGTRNLFWRMADGSGTEERLTTGDGNHTPVSWSPDGRVLMFSDATLNNDIWFLQLEDRKMQPFLQTPFYEGTARFSPDGRFVAYLSDESGRNEIYVRPYPGPGAKWQISTEGGIEPVWNPRGGELFYRNGNKMMAVELATQPTLKFGAPRMLFVGDYVPTLTNMQNYDASPDGRRFLMIQPGAQETTTPTQINVVLNGFEELKRIVPTN